jgi:hypothetical protein
MKTNEVRVGNRVLFAEDGTEFIVTDIVGSGLNVKNEEENTWIEADQFEGIPLTGEWLLKFGFDEHAIGYYNKDFVIFLSYANTGLHQYRLRDFNTIIKYVHQLQNLYFALTGEELTIKENETTNPL